MASNSVLKKAVTDNVALVTTPGLKKIENEDAIDFRLQKDQLQIVLADGHWGTDAAQAAVKHWLQRAESFSSRDEAIAQTKKLEAEIYTQQRAQISGHVDQQLPETSFITAQINVPSLKAFAYGDCRLLVVRNQKIIFSLKQHATWLGAFSYLGMRQRIPVSQAIEYTEQSLEPGDTVLIFSDGIDEPVYEQPTISWEELAALCKEDSSSEAIADAIMSLVFHHGAEDNASLAVIKVA